ncbi:hypothetical protein IG631_22470 [Alternaria alternata]|nr:hypothetical protein IG631_22470 [Alternaria alternata]
MDARYAFTVDPFRHAPQPTSTPNHQIPQWRRVSRPSTAASPARSTPPASACCRSTAAACVVCRRCTSSKVSWRG